MNLEVLYLAEKQNQRVAQQHQAKNIPAIIRLFSQEYRDARRQSRNIHENN